MEEGPKKEPRPLTKKEVEYAKERSEELRAAAQGNDAETVRHIRQQLIEAVKTGTLSYEDALNVAFTPYFDKENDSE